MVLDFQFFNSSIADLYIVILIFLDCKNNVFRNTKQIYGLKNVISDKFMALKM